MSVATKLNSLLKPVMEPRPRAILGPSGDSVRVSDESERSNEALKKPQRRKIQVCQSPQSVVQRTVSVDSSSSPDSSSSNASVKTVSSRKTVKRNGVKQAKVAPTADEAVTGISPVISELVKRCDWITPFSDAMYSSFHDEEWGVPVHDDRKLFELLVLSQALAELSWPTILNKRDIFRKLFDNFETSSTAQFTEEKMLSLKVDGSLLHSEPKLCAVVENAKQMLKVQQDFGSFSSYSWGFVDHKPLRNGFRYARQVPAKPLKAEVMSKDMIQRGCRCVGPTVVYSFMQVAGIVNDHLVTCFRYQESNANIKMENKPRIEKIEKPSKDAENTCLSS